MSRLVATAVLRRIATRSGRTSSSSSARILWSLGIPGNGVKLETSLTESKRSFTKSTKTLLGQELTGAARSLLRDVGRKPSGNEELEGQVFQKASAAFPRTKSDSVREVAKGIMKARPPIVEIMGHVDHGKTLLDALRLTSLAKMETVGIMLRLGAFQVNLKCGASMTFLDTPSDALLRGRGAAVTDIIVLVVAADEGVTPNTRKVMKVAADARIPIVVALSICDEARVSLEKIRRQLAAEGMEPDTKVQVFEMSATRKMGLDELEEAVWSQAESMGLKASEESDVHAVVVQARLVRDQIPLATVLVRDGTLNPGQYVVVGAHWGRIRALRDVTGLWVTSAGPSVPVVIHGLRGLPEAGDKVRVVANEEVARKLSKRRFHYLRSQGKLSPSLVGFKAPIKDLIEKALTLGYAKRRSNGEARATSYSRLVCAEGKYIVNHYTSVIRRVVDPYALAKNRSSLRKVVYIYRKSCALTLARKHRLRSARAAYLKFGPNLEIKEEGQVVASLELPTSLKPKGNQSRKRVAKTSDKNRR